MRIVAKYCFPLVGYGTNFLLETKMIPSQVLSILTLYIFDVFCKIQFNGRSVDCVVKVRDTFFMERK